MKVQEEDDEEENEYNKTYEEDENNSLHENKRDQVGDEIYCLSTYFIFLIF